MKLMIKIAMAALISFSFGAYAQENSTNDYTGYPAGKECLRLEGKSEGGFTLDKNGELRGTIFALVSMIRDKNDLDIKINSQEEVIFSGKPYTFFDINVTYERFTRVKNIHGKEIVVKAGMKSPEYQNVQMVCPHNN